MNKEEIFEILYDKEKWEVYRKFQELENSIENSNDLYKYIDEIIEMLLSDKSFIRVRGFRLLCMLSKWDKDNKINKNINIILNELDDNKPTNIRQCLSSIKTLILLKPELLDKIINKIKHIDYQKYKDSMGSLIKKDIDQIISNYEK